MIVSSGQTYLRAGKIVGGGPAVAKRQAIALAARGIDVDLLDIDYSKNATNENWEFEKSGVKVYTRACSIDRQSLNFYRCSSENGYPLAGVDLASCALVQEHGYGAITSWLKRLGLCVVLQPNDYSFLCARSWFLMGSGQRCDMQPSVLKCGACQTNGRNALESTAIKADYALGKFLSRTPLGISKKVDSAKMRAIAGRQMLSDVDYFLAQSSKMYEVIKAQGITEDRILRNDYGVDPPSSSKKHARSHMVTFAYIARPSFEKGLHLLLAAWARVPKSEVKKARLKIYSPISSAPYFQRKRLLKALNRCENLIIDEKTQTFSILDEIYSDIDVTVQPSLWIDHNTQTVLESLSRGVPAIVPNHTSFRDGIISPGKNGILIDLDDDDSLLSAIRSLISDESLLANLKQNTMYKHTDKDWAIQTASWLHQINKMDSNF